jgi:uncharacterized protein
MTVHTTALYALPLAVLGLVLWFRVTGMRSALKVSIGDAGNSVLHERIRQHGNFIEWVPMVLILMLIAESLGVRTVFVHSAGALLLFGRLVHPFGLKAANPSHVLRIVGNSSNLLATILLIGCLAAKLSGF